MAAETMQDYTRQLISDTASDTIMSRQSTTFATISSRRGRRLGLLSKRQKSKARQHVHLPFPSLPSSLLQRARAIDIRTNRIFCFVYATGGQRMKYKHCSRNRSPVKIRTFISRLKVKPPCHLWQDEMGCLTQSSPLGRMTRKSFTNFLKEPRFHHQMPFVPVSE